MFKSNTSTIMGSNLDLYDVVKRFENDEFFSNFDKLFGGSAITAKYPPTNTKRTKDGYAIEMALAGYKREDISVSRQGDTLTIQGKKQEESDQSEYIYKGISNKSFTRSFTLGKGTEVTDVSLTDGLLTVTIHQHKPEQKSKTFEIK